ncbi:MAG: RluA family pseudouridine synthase [Candidatus Magasanikbacteria bacterium]|nr:RluA family pseudouridine synthase [Candidatus Magasanikbacteria bacterium]
MPTTKKIIVDQESAGTRLDVFLSDKLEISRSQIQKMIDNKQIGVDGNTPKKYGEKLRDEDIISIASANKKTSAQKMKKQADEKGFPKPEIIAETPDYIIVNKPAGLLTHPTEANEKSSLAGWIVKKFPAIKKVGDDPMRPGIVHRLDKEASGLLVIARTQKMFNHLKEQFKNRTIDKEYIVLVHGRVDKDWDEINFPIGRSETADKMAAMPQTVRGQPTESGKEAKTEFFVEKRFVNFTLLHVKIHTGRMHQIRTHMLAYNRPVVGDPLYFQKKQKRVWDEKCGRLFLHSAKLGFKNLVGDEVEYKSPMPDKLSNFLLLLR